VDKPIVVVLVHGFAEDAAIWQETAAWLQPEYRLLIPDLPGSGRSSLRPGGTSMETLAADLKNILDQEDIDKCVIIGHSMGGYVTLAFAEQYPERLHGLGLYHSTAYADSDEKRAARRKSIDFIRHHGAAPFIRQSTPNLFAASTREDRPQMVEETILRYSGFSPDSLVQYYEAMIRRPDRTDVLRQFAGPVLFIMGGKDQVIPIEQSLQQCHLPSLSHVHILDDAGHMGMLEAPETGSGIIRSFYNFILNS
jgi:pimeloyl-ACP methyl ester carboxylesterase